MSFLPPLSIDSCANVTTPDVRSVEDLTEDVAAAVIMACHAVKKMKSDPGLPVVTQQELLMAASNEHKVLSHRQDASVLNAIKDLSLEVKDLSSKVEELKALVVATSHNATARQANGLMHFTSTLQPLRKEAAGGEYHVGVLPGLLPEVAGDGQEGVVAAQQQQEEEEEGREQEQEAGAPEEPAAEVDIAAPGPAIFPRTKHKVFTLTQAQLNELAKFYKRDFGGVATKVQHRQYLFAMFIGVPI